MQKRIEKVLREATAADEAADWALRQDSNGKNSDSFNKNIYTSLDSARDAKKDMAEALRLTKKGEDLTNDELGLLGKLLSKRKNDMVFAEKFALSMGPKGALEFWREASGPNSGERGGERNTALKQLQASLGSTLGIATQSESAAMDGWKEKMRALGPQMIDPGGIGGPSAKGYQLMSSLMRSGSYDSDFLHDYGRDLLSYEKTRSPSTPRELWAPDSTMPRIDYSGDGPGADPMTGYMDALSKNPEAATGFLDPGEPRENGNLKYLVDDREWVEDGFDKKTGQGSLALAIEAYPPGISRGRKTRCGSTLHRKPGSCVTASICSTVARRTRSYLTACIVRSPMPWATTPPTRRTCFRTSTMDQRVTMARKHRGCGRTRRPGKCVWPLTGIR